MDKETRKRSNNLDDAKSDKLDEDSIENWLGGGSSVPTQLGHR